MQNSFMVMGVCLRYSSDTEEAEDLTQETFIKVFKSIKQFNNDGDIGAWIRRIAINTALEKYRSDRRQKGIMKTLNIDYIEDVVQDDLYDNLELEELLIKIQELPMGFRTVFNLYAIEGFKHREIAEKLGISVGTSKSQFARARQALRVSIEREESNLEKILNG